MYEEMRNAYKILVGHLKNGDHSEDVGVVEIMRGSQRNRVEI